MDYGDQDGMGYHGEDGMMYADGDMMGSDDEGMGHGMGDSYGHEGSPGQYEVRLMLRINSVSELIRGSQF